MKISMISEHASPLAALGGVDAGGQNVHVASLSRALAARGHQITVFTRRDSPDLSETVVAEPGVTVVHVTAGPVGSLPKDEFLPFMPGFGREVARYWCEHPEAVPDVVHSHFWMSGLAARTALDTAELTGTPLVHTFHALGTVKRRYQGAADTSPVERAWIEPQIGQLATHVIATCHDEVRELKAMGISPTKTSVIPCGVDLEMFTPDKLMEPTGGRRRIVCVGRLVPRKGMDLVIRALPLLAQHGFDDVDLHIIGGGEQGSLEHDPEAARLRQIATDLGVSERVIFRGQVPREEVPSILRSADLVACTPWYEPFGIVPLEAMACGVPVLAAKVGGLADTVVDNATGMHVPPQDPAAIAAAAATVLRDPARIAEMGAHGVRRARRHYAWPVVAKATEAAYQQLLNGTPPTGSRSMGDDGIATHLDGVATAVDSLRSQSGLLALWGRELAATLGAGGRLFTAGNGGSAAEAQHLSAELVGRFQGERPAYSAMALHTDSSAVTAISNDYGYEHVFARQLEGHARAGDVLLLLSTSGTSPNLLRAAETARKKGLRVWALTGPGPNPLAALCDEVITVDADSPNVQEAHLMAVHGICRAFDAEVAHVSHASFQEV